MAELNTECCAPTVQEICCEPQAKGSCCGEGHAAGCGCAAGAEAVLVGSGAAPDDVRETVREKYAEAARSAARGEFRQARAVESLSGEDADFYGSSPADRTGVFGSALYDEASREQIPDTAVMASLGCGVPTAVADLHPGEVVLDLGSGAGADVLISARRVGPTGKAIGLDMTDEMLELARTNAAEAGVENVEFVKGYLEDMPLEDESVDVVISNCVINLSGDKPQRDSRGGPRVASRRSVCRLGRDRRSRHGRADPRGHGGLDGLHRRRADRGRVPRRAGERRLRRHRDHRDAPGARARRLGNHPRRQALAMNALVDRLRIRS